MAEDEEDTIDEEVEEENNEEEQEEMEEVSGDIPEEEIEEDYSDEEENDDDEESEDEENDTKKDSSKKTTDVKEVVSIQDPKRVIPVEISGEMKKAYLDYAMSVIVSRAIPAIEDGLKPVQRRILYSMDLMGVKPGTPTKKSARIVGDVIGKYHPHGDTAVYETMVRMAQPFSLRYPLVYGQGNFGSIDGDPPAAMRYTETRLMPIVTELVEDLDKDTVKFVPNYDNSLKEPELMPGKLPNLLINGAMGIAVGMATNIPPHNLTEVCDAIIAYVKNPEMTIEDLCQIIS